MTTRLTPEQREANLRLLAEPAHEYIKASALGEALALLDAERQARAAAEQEAAELKRHIGIELLPEDPSSTKANWIDRCFAAERDLAALRERMANLRNGLLILGAEREHFLKHANNEPDRRHFTGALQIINNLLPLLAVPPMPEPHP